MAARTEKKTSIVAPCAFAVAASAILTLSTLRNQQALTRQLSTFQGVDFTMKIPSVFGDVIGSDGISQVCSSNPFLSSLNESNPEIIVNRAEAWLEALDSHYNESSKAIYNNWNHARFFPFEPMAKCTNITCVGGTCGSDQSKQMCGIHQLSSLDSTLPQSRSDEPYCIVYSIGGNNRWDFELDILQRTPCEVHTLDCTGPRKRFIVPSNPRLHFHHVCLGAEPQEASPNCTHRKAMCGPVSTLEQIQEMLGHHETKIDLLKMDIEGSEWPMLEGWPTLSDADETDNRVALPMQILMEVSLDIRRSSFQ